MTQGEMCAALQVDPEWSVLWSGADRLRAVEHWCVGLYGPGGTYTSETVLLPYRATETPGIEAARCERCRVAWVRRVEEG